MAIFHSYVSLPEGICPTKKKLPMTRHQLHRRALAADIAHGFLLMAMHQLLFDQSGELNLGGRNQPTSMG